MKKITLDEFCHLKFLSSPEYSPEGGHLVFVRSEADPENNRYTSNLFELVTDGKTQTVRQLTSGGKERAFQFLDEDTILFAADRDEKKDQAPSLETKY